MNFLVGYLAEIAEYLDAKVRRFQCEQQIDQIQTEKKFKM